MSKQYDVGYGKPPKHSRFEKGKSGNPAGRPKKYRSGISVLEEPVRMTVDGKRREVTAFEASLRKTAQSALEGHLSAIKRFFTYCDEAGLLVNQNKPATSGVYYIPLSPKQFPSREFTDAELKELDRINKKYTQPPPADPPTEKQAIIIKVAEERHFVEMLGHRLSIFELIQQKLRHRALVERHEPSHAYFEKLLTRTTLDIDAPNAGFLVVSVPVPPWLTPIRIENADTGEEIRIPRPGEPDFDPDLHSV